MYPLLLPSFPNSLGNSFYSCFFFFFFSLHLAQFNHLSSSVCVMQIWASEIEPIWIPGFSSRAEGLIEKMNSSVSVCLPFAPSRAVSRLPFYIALSFILAHCTMLLGQSDVWIRRGSHCLSVSLSCLTARRGLYLRSWTPAEETREDYFWQCETRVYLELRIGQISSLSVTGNFS